MRVTLKALEAKLDFANELLEAGRHPMRLWYKVWPSGKKSLYWHEPDDRDTAVRAATPAQRIGLCRDWLDAFGEGALAILVRHGEIIRRERDAAHQDVVALQLLRTVAQNALDSGAAHEQRPEDEGAELEHKIRLFLLDLTARIEALEWFA